MYSIHNLLLISNGLKRRVFLSFYIYWGTTKRSQMDVTFIIMVAKTKESFPWMNGLADLWNPMSVRCLQWSLSIGLSPVFKESAKICNEMCINVKNKLKTTYRVHYLQIFITPFYHLFSPIAVTKNWRARQYDFLHSITEHIINVANR